MKNKLPQYISDATTTLPPKDLEVVSNSCSFHDWQENNKYFRKWFSILGDSISTLEGYNPRFYNIFYSDIVCTKTDVREMSDTWWGKVIEYFGGRLLVNNSWSGCRVTQLPNRDILYPSGCCEDRTGGLHQDAISPDVIIIYMGINDWADGLQAEAENDTGDDMHIFSTAYEKMVTDIEENYPNAEIFCCTLAETIMKSNPLFTFFVNYGGVHIETYNKVIRRVANKKGCKLIDLYSKKIPYDSIDGFHPTADGMNTLAELVISGIMDSVN